MGVIWASINELEDEANGVGEVIMQLQKPTVNIDAVVPVGDIEPGRVERLMLAARKFGSAALGMSKAEL